MHFSKAHTIPEVGGVADVAPDEAAVTPDEAAPDEEDNLVVPSVRELKNKYPGERFILLYGDSKHRKDINPVKQGQRRIIPRPVNQPK